MKLFSKYTLIARIFPAVLSLIPFLGLQYLLSGNFYKIDSLALVFASNVTLATVLLYFFTQYFVRIPSKLFEDWLFGRQLYFPTTNFLLYSDSEYTDTFKDLIRKAIKKDFSIQLPNKAQEQSDEISCRKSIKEVIGLIIGKVRDGHLVLQHNIEYGFVRNLWGASLVGLFGSSLLGLFSFFLNEWLFLLVALGLLGVYFLYILLGFVIIKYCGRLYAKKLVDEFYKISYEK